MGYAARPVPQNIMNVEFKVFDFLTVKQLFIGVGILIVAVLLFFVLPSGWNITISGFIIFLGFIVLFVPFNGDPFLVFVSNYLEAMITDQRRVWHKKGIILKTAAQKALYYRYGAEVPLSKIDSYFMIGSKNNIQQSNNTTNIDQLENEFLSKSNQLQQEIDTRVTYKSTSQSGINLSKESKFIHTSSTPSESFGVVNLLDLNTPNSQNFINSETYVKRESEVEVKNFIFGYVEDEKENPISGAIINLKQNDAKVIEVLISNAAGEFKTAYEYPEGEYLLEATKDGKNINEIKIYHNPIDPEPVILSYAAQKTENNINNNTTLSNKQDVANVFLNSTNSDVFEGEYDPSFFSVDNVINETLDNNLPNTKEYQDNNVKATSFVPNTQQYPNSSSKDSLHNDYNNSLNIQNEIINFVNLPNAKIDVNFNSELIYLFNTINGCIVNKNNLPIKGIDVRILDSTGKLVNSAISDNAGCFYSISPLPNGYYFIDFVFGNNANTKVLLKCFVILNGLVIHPKLIVLNI